MIKTRPYGGDEMRGLPVGEVLAGGHRSCGHRKVDRPSSESLSRSA